MGISGDPKFMAPWLGNFDISVEFSVDKMRANKCKRERKSWIYFAVAVWMSNARKPKNRMPSELEWIHMNCNRCSTTNRQTHAHTLSLSQGKRKFYFLYARWQAYRKQYTRCDCRRRCHSGANGQNYGVVALLRLALSFSLHLSGVYQQHLKNGERFVFSMCCWQHWYCVSEYTQVYMAERNENVALDSHTVNNYATCAPCLRIFPCYFYTDSCARSDI